MSVCDRSGGEQDELQRADRMLQAATLGGVVTVVLTAALWISAWP
jgi:hypothetical protein